MEKKSPLQAGMELYAVPVDKNNKPGVATVEKVGRKWAQVRIENWWAPELFDKNTWEQKPTGYGYNKDYTLWPSKEEFEDSIAFVAWKRDFLAYKANFLPREFWDKVRALYESKDWSHQE